MLAELTRRTAISSLALVSLCLAVPVRADTASDREKLLDQATENCGYEIGETQDWGYDDVFNFNSPRLSKLLV